MPNHGRVRLLINCSNLHVGGAVAVATSFIAHLAKIEDPEAEIGLLLSTPVHANLVAFGTDLARFASCRVEDHVGAQAFWRGLDRHFEGQDVVFTVFGPAYFLRKRTRHVFGFAQPLVIYPGNPSEREMPWGRRLHQRFKARLHEVFFARADALIVELEHVKAGLARRPLLRGLPTHVVYSTVDSVYRDGSRWLPITLPAGTGARLRLGIISRNYPHKNLKSLPALKQCLRDGFGLDADIFVTFTDEEWQACPEAFRRSIHNAGPLKLAQCPCFYDQMDGVVFPSLLECFSAVPIEAMLMKRPLFASDLPFIRDCCHGHASYFDPMDARSMAAAVHAWFAGDPETRSRRLDEAFAFVQGYPGPQERAQSYLRIALDVAARH